MAAYLESEENVHATTYLKNIADVGYQLFVVNEAGQEQYYGDPFSVENLAPTAVQDVLKGSEYHGMREYPL